MALLASSGKPLRKDKPAHDEETSAKESKPSAGTLTFFSHFQGFTCGM